MPFETKTYTLDRNIPIYGRWFDRGEDKFEITEDGTLQKYLGYCTNIILPSSVKKIKDIAPSEFVSGTSDQLNDQDGTRLSAFQNVLNELEYIYINEECTEIGSCAFRSCENLSNIYFKGNKVTRLGEYSFAFCTSLTSINIPTSVKNIEKRAFYGTTSLKNITGADGVEVIGDDAFINSNLQVVELASVKQIGKMAFSGCYNLKSLILKNSAVVSTNVTETSGDNNNNVLYLSVDAKIYVPSNLINSYKLTFPWNAYSDRILDISELQNE
ncbi:MAG: leucine-rich repeat domain-containing protein [Christensenellales bacterium]